MSTETKDVKGTAGSKDRSMLPILSAVSCAFALAIIVSIYSLAKLARENTKEIDTMLTYRIYDSIASSLNEPIIVAQTMACDDFLSDFLQDEKNLDEDEAVRSWNLHPQEMNLILQRPVSLLTGSEKRDSIRRVQ